MMKKILSFALALAFIAAMFTSCDNGKDDVTALSFSQADSLEEIRALDGKQVSVIGYMSNLMPAGGEFMYLVNLPCQNQPFCIPSTSELSNTVSVYASEGEHFEFTDMAIRVTGTVELGDGTDAYGYKYSYRIKDATYKVLDGSDMSSELELWQELASSGLITDVYEMLEFLSFVCFWPTHTVELDGEMEYLSPKDALSCIETDGAEFSYGYKDGYFDGIAAGIKNVDEAAFSQLLEIVERAKALYSEAYSELKSGNYVMVSEYSGVFNDLRGQYKMDKSAQIGAEYDSLFEEFSNWLGNWEL